MLGQLHRNLLRLLFFVYGASIHFLLFRFYVHVTYSGVPSRHFVNHPLTNIVVVLLGGIVVSVFMCRLLQRSLERREYRGFYVILRGGLAGVLATALAAAVFSILTSVVLAAWMSTRNPYYTSFYNSWALWMISVSTMAMAALTVSLPFDFVYGAVAAALILWLRRYIRLPHARGGPPQRPDARSALTATGTSLARMGTFLFLFGASVHLLLLRAHVHLAPSSSDSEQRFLNHLATNVLMALLGGVFVTLVMWRLFRQAEQQRDACLGKRNLIVKGGLCGILATTLTVEVFLCMTSSIIWFYAGTVFRAAFRNSFLYSMGALLLYGLLPIIFSLPFLFVYGTVAGVLVLSVAKRRGIT